MSVRHVSIATTLTLLGPVLSKSTTSGGMGLDAPMAQSGGKYYLPYSLVRGRLRESLEELVSTGAAGINDRNIVDWFGPREKEAGGSGKTFLRDNLSDPSSGFDPERGLLRFSDFICENKTEHPPVRVRIKIDDERGAVDEGALQMIESPFAPGAEVKFVGRIEFLADVTEETLLTEWLKVGLRWTPSLGSGRTFGFGRIKSVEFAEPCRHPYGKRPGSASGVAATRLGLLLRFEGPFCVARAGPAGNLFESDDVVSGGVIRGAIASLLKALAGEKPWKSVDVSGLKPKPPGFEKLAEHLDSVRITHAFPAEGYDLQLMPKGANVSDLPTEEKAQVIIIADLEKGLHFRIFDDDGRMVVDIDETSLPEEVGPIADLKKQLGALWPPHPLPDAEKDRVITTATSIVGHTWVRNVRPPLSIVTAKNTVKDQEDEIFWRDVALAPGPTLLGNPPRAPAFAIDWKDKQRKKVEEDFPWTKTTRELRVRTEIDASKRRAQEGQLFAYEMVLPQQRVWLAWIDLSRVDAADRGAVEQQLRGLLAGPLPGIGKTKVTARAEVLESGKIKPSYAASQAPFPDGVRIVTLQTPALLCGNRDKLNEASGEQELHDAYQQTWDELSGRTLELVRFFARQRLAGGYLALRHQPGKPYNPFLVTEPGSVFVLKPRSGKETVANKRLDDWLEQGLPLPDWANLLYKWTDPRTSQEYPGNHWRTCPFRPQDGFGEIALDLDCHNHTPGGSRP